MYFQNFATTEAQIDITWEYEGEVEKESIAVAPGEVSDRQLRWPSYTWDLDIRCRRPVSSVTSLDAPAPSIPQDSAR